MYLCRNMTSESFPKIGTEFGGKDHSTVMHSVEKIEQEIKVNPDLAKIIEKLKKDIGEGIVNKWLIIIKFSTIKIIINILNLKKNITYKQFPQ